MRLTDGQARKLMEELSKHGKIGLAAMRAGMDRKTARKYADLGQLPSELTEPRHWRTRQDPFEEDWAELAARLKDAPELDAKRRRLIQSAEDSRLSGNQDDPTQQLAQLLAPFCVSLSP